MKSTETTTADPVVETVTIEDLRAELKQLEADVASHDLVAAIERAVSVFRDAGQPNVVGDLVASMCPDDPRNHCGPPSTMSPASLAAMIPADRRDEFSARLAALVAGLRHGVH